MKNMKKLVIIPLAALAVYGVTSFAPIKPYSVEFGEGYRCETRLKESRIKFYKDGKLIGEKTKTKYGDEYWFVDNEGNRYEEIRGNFRIRPRSDWGGETAEEFQEYVNKKIKEGKETLEELKIGEYLLERLMKK